MFLHLGVAQRARFYHDPREYLPARLPRFILAVFQGDNFVFDVFVDNLSRATGSQAHLFRSLLGDTFDAMGIPIGIHVRGRRALYLVGPGAGV